MAGRDYVDKDLYAELGVSKGASAAEVKKAYRALAKKLHPDNNPGDATAENKFKAVSEAYHVLSDPQRRKEYDEARELFAAGRFHTPGGFGGNGGGVGGFDIGDLLRNSRPGASGGMGGLGDLLGGLGGMFGRGGTRAAPRRGATVQAAITIGFAEALEGLQVPIRIPGGGACATCGGTGAKPGTTPRTCPTCSGAGVITRNQGGFAFSEPCQTCGGDGRVVTDPCPTCAGSGRTDRVQQVRIPAGVADGQKVVARGRGAPGENGGPAGDLEVTVRVSPHPVFGRDGDDLTITVPVTYLEAALGTTVSVPTLEQPVRLRIPVGTQPGKVLRVRGRGVPRKDGTRGNLLVTVAVTVPTHMTEEAAEALHRYADLVAEHPRKHMEEQVAATRGGAS